MTRRLYACLVGIALLLPVMLGPATAPLMRALGALEEHHCACGMKAGKCGCPECALLEKRQKADDELLRGQPLVRASCDDGTVASPSVFARATLPATVVVAAAISEIVPPSRAPALPSRDPPPPPTPPPRLARA